METQLYEESRDMGSYRAMGNVQSAGDCVVVSTDGKHFHNFSFTF